MLKRIVKYVCVILACCGFLLMASEPSDPASVSVRWNFIGAAVLFLSCKVLDKMGVFGEDEEV